MVEAYWDCQKLPKLPKIAEIEKQNLTADERGLTRMRKKQNLFFYGKA